MGGQPKLLVGGAPIFEDARAVCRDVDPELFFPLRSDDPSAEAKAVCNRCPIKARRAQHALDRPLLVGVWGGTTESERKNLRRRRQRCPNCGAARRCDDPWICDEARAKRMEDV